MPIGSLVPKQVLMIAMLFTLIEAFQLALCALISCNGDTFHSRVVLMLHRTPGPFACYCKRGPYSVQDIGRL